MKIDHFFRDVNNAVIAVDSVGTQLLLDPVSIVLLKPQIGDYTSSTSATLNSGPFGKGAITVNAGGQLAYLLT